MILNNLCTLICLVEAFEPLTAYHGLDLWQLMYNYYYNNTWLADTPHLHHDIVKLGLEDMNMFYMAQFLHNASVLDIKSQEGVLNEVAAGSVVGRLDSSRLVMPSAVGEGSAGLLVVALDPNYKMADRNRTDNVFVEFVTVNSSSAASPPTVSAYSMEEPAACSVSPKSQGQCSTWYLI